MPTRGTCRPVLGLVAYELGVGWLLSSRAGDEVAASARTFGGRGEGIGGDHPDGAGDTASRRRGGIRLTVEAGAEQPATVATGQVVAEQTCPDEGVDVQVDHVAREVEVDGFA